MANLMLHIIYVKSGQSLWRELLQEIQGSEGIASQEWLQRDHYWEKRAQQWMLAAAKFSVYLRALLPLCALAKNSMPQLTEECCQVLIQSQGSPCSPEARRGHGILPWPGILCSLWHITPSVVKQSPKSTSILRQKGVEQRDPCLQIKQAA